jgi:tetratricopeptide (TPR) repeat protein
MVSVSFSKKLSALRMRWLAFLGCLICGHFGFTHRLSAQSQTANLTDNVPSVREKRYEKAVTFYRQGSIKESAIALDQCLQMLAQNPGPEIQSVNSIAIHAMLGECFYLDGNLDAAMFQFDKAVEMASRNGAWFQQIPWDGSVQRVVFEGVNEAVDIDPRTNVVAFDGSEILRGLATTLFRRRIILDNLARSSDSMDRLSQQWSIPNDKFGKSVMGSLNICVAYG